MDRFVHTKNSVKSRDYNKIRQKFLAIEEKIIRETKKIRQIDGNYVKSAKDLVLGRKFHSQKSLQTKMHRFDEIFCRQRKFLSKILFSKVDGNDFCMNFEHLKVLSHYLGNLNNFLVTSFIQSRNCFQFKIFKFDIRLFENI